MSAATAIILGAHGADSLAATLLGKRPQPLSFAYSGQGIALGRGNGIGFNSYPGQKPHHPYFTGWLAYQIREWGARYLANLARFEKRRPGAFFWPGKGRYAAAKRRQERQQQSATSQARRSTVLVFGIGGRFLNPVMRRLAGKRHMRQFAVLQHRGRRSGRLYETPVVVRPTDDGFMVPLPFGERTDWFRNVQAAGTCVIRWNGIVYHLVEPQVMDWAAARPAFRGFERIVVPFLGIKIFVRFRRAPEVEGRAA